MADLQTDILHLFRDNPVGDAVRDIPWAFSVSETLHFIGLSMLVGALLLVDLRILGVAKNVSYATVLKLVPVAILGFAINLISGFVLFTSDPFMYWPNPLFKLKMAVVVLAGLNALWFTFAEEKKLLALPEGAKVPTMIRTTAILSLTFWLLVILGGRLLPTFEAYGDVGFEPTPVAAPASAP